MRERIAACVAGLLVLLAGGAWMGQLPSQQYVTSALASSGDMQPPGATIVPVHLVPGPEPGPIPSGVDAGYRVNLGAIAFRAAAHAGIRHPRLFVRQMAAESGFNPCVSSPVGAVGVAQIMPSTANAWGVDPFLPAQALAAAAKHMARYERQYGSYALALAAYNAGAGAVAQYHGIPPYRETRSYVSIIMGHQDIWGLHHEVFTLPSRFTPTFQLRLHALLQDVRRHGGQISIVSGTRSYQKQLQLWAAAIKTYGSWEKGWRWVAPPGCSAHNRGEAADLKGSLALAHRLAPRHGLLFPLSNENWHVSDVPNGQS